MEVSPEDSAGSISVSEGDLEGAEIGFDEEEEIYQPQSTIGPAAEGSQQSNMSVGHAASAGKRTTPGKVDRKKSRDFGLKQYVSLESHLKLHCVVDRASSRDLLVM
eukprot:scaffold182696_cov20-Prasinocladus_malaysianus.AAC.1